MSPATVERGGVHWANKEVTEAIDLAERMGLRRAILPSALRAALTRVPIRSRRMGRTQVAYPVASNRSRTCFWLVHNGRQATMNMAERVGFEPTDPG
jgi:hypothetical protein